MNVTLKWVNRYGAGLFMTEKGNLVFGSKVQTDYYLRTGCLHKYLEERLRDSDIFQLIAMYRDIKKFTKDSFVFFDRISKKGLNKIEVKLYHVKFFDFEGSLYIFANKNYIYYYKLRRLNSFHELSCYKNAKEITLEEAIFLFKSNKNKN